MNATEKLLTSKIITMALRNIPYGIVILMLIAYSTVNLAATNNGQDERRIPGRQYGNDGVLLVTGQYITPLAAPGSYYQELDTELRPDGDATADGAYSTALSPDGKTLLVLTNGFNSSILTPYYTMKGEKITFPYLDPLTGETSEEEFTHTQWVFIFDVSSDKPVKQQVINIPSSYAGIAWDPNGKRFYVSGGQDDRVYIYKRGKKNWVPDAPFILLGHNSNNTAPKPNYDGGIFKGTPAGESEGGKAYGLNFGAMTAGVSVSEDGTQVFAVNMQNDSVSIIDAKTREVTKEIQLFVPGSTEPQGGFPMWVTPHTGPDGKTDKIYVTSVRDGQVISINLSDEKQKTIQLDGAPTKMLLSQDQNKLYVANPDLDEIDEINVEDDTLIRRISVQRSDFKYRGANPNSMELASDDNTLYVTLGGENAIAVIDLKKGEVIGRIPTAWYPTSVTLSKDNSDLFVINFKSTGGPNPGGGGFSSKGTEYQKNANPTFKKQHVQQMLTSGIVSMPTPDKATLIDLTKQVDANNHLDDTDRRQASDMMKFLRDKIKHVIYIMKENRSYDQILGDLPVGNGDPRLTSFGKETTPNHHKLALEFVTLDNFYVPNESSGDGWGWITQGHGNEFLTVVHQFNDGSFFQAVDFGTILGVPRQQNVALPIFPDEETLDLMTARSSTYFDPTGQSTILPGPGSPAVTFGADDHDPDATGGYIWDSIIRAGKTVRHYGLWTDSFPYYQFNSKDNFGNTFFVKADPDAPGYPPVVRDAYEKKVVQAVATAPGLIPYTDPYYRGFDMNVPEEYRYEEWKREFDVYVENGNLPNFMPMLMPMNHIGNLQGSNVGGLHTPESQIASNDHAIGLLVSAVSRSPYWKNTAIFIIEDDTYDGPDHVHSHRTTAFVISPYTKRNAVVSEFYNTPSMVRTILDLMDSEYLGFNDALANSMDEVFTKEPNLEPYTHVIPGILLEPPVDQTLVSNWERNDPNVARTEAVQLHDGEWWAEKTKDFNFDDPDSIDTDVFNRLLWSGVKGEDVPYPTQRTGKDLSINREEFLRRVQNHPMVSSTPNKEDLSEYSNID